MSSLKRMARQNAPLKVRARSIFSLKMFFFKLITLVFTLLLMVFFMTDSGERAEDFKQVKETLHFAFKFVP